MVTGTLNVFSFTFYTLLDPGYTLSFFTPLVANRVELLPDILHEPFLVSTPRKDDFRSKEYIKNSQLILFIYSTMLI